MPIPFEVELIYSYLTEIGLPEEFTLDHIQNSYVGHGLSQKIDILANILLDSIENSVDDPDNHEQEHSDWRSAYDTISAVHFDYIYGRVWEYKTDGELLPQDLSKRFKDVLLVETDLVDMACQQDFLGAVGTAPRPVHSCGATTALRGRRVAYEPRP